MASPYLDNHANSALPAPARSDTAPHRKNSTGAGLGNGYARRPEYPSPPAECGTVSAHGASLRSSVARTTSLAIELGFVARARSFANESRAYDAATREHTYLLKKDTCNEENESSSTPTA